MYKYAPYISFNIMNKKVYIIDERASTVFSLEGVAKEVWKLCDKNIDLESIVKHIAKIYQMSSEEISKDIQDLVLEFNKLELIMDDSNY